VAKNIRPQIVHRYLPIFSIFI